MGDKNLYIVTGCCGFIGFHTTARLLREGHDVIGIDSMNNYFPQMKPLRLNQLKGMNITGHFEFLREDLAADIEGIVTVLPGIIEEMDKHYSGEGEKIMIHLAAQAGVRYSGENPGEFVSSNLLGFYNAMEIAVQFGFKFMYASSSSVYGSASASPEFESMKVVQEGRLHPKSFYAATKLANELMAESYYHQHDLPSIGMRFFSVYGPWGREDLVMIKWLNLMTKDLPVTVFNKGHMFRDWTYIDDVVDAILLLAGMGNDKPLIVNIGRGEPYRLDQMLDILADKAILEPKIEFTPDIPKDDIYFTKADITFLKSTFNWKAKTDLSTGIGKLVEWYFRTYIHYLQTGEEKSYEG